MCRNRLHGSRAARGAVAEAPSTLADALNPEALAAVTADGTIFHRYFAAHGLRVPIRYGAIGRAGGWSAVSGRPLTDAVSACGFLAHQAPGELVIAPSGGGPGARVLQREGAAFRDRDGRRWEVPALVAAILADPRDDLHIVRERLGNHADLARVAGTEGLARVRITTSASRDGRVEIAHAALSQAGAPSAPDRRRDQVGSPALGASPTGRRPPGSRGMPATGFFPSDRSGSTSRSRRAARS